MKEWRTKESIGQKENKYQDSRHKSIFTSSDIKCKWSTYSNQKADWHYGWNKKKNQLYVSYKRDISDSKTQINGK